MFGTLKTPRAAETFYTVLLRERCLPAYILCVLCCRRDAQLLGRRNKKQTDGERGLEPKQRFDKEMVFTFIRRTSAE